MKKIRRSEARGHADHGWLDTHHSFSFAGYHDPDHMGFRALRVLNEDRVAAGRGFGQHPHRDMEIVSIVLDGALEHKDSMGTGSVLHPGDVQAMSAGTGVVHSEFNGSKTDPVHFLQIWIEPDASGTKPRYDERRFTPESMQDRFALVVSEDGRDGSIEIGRDARMWRGQWSAAGDAEVELKGAGRHAWVHVIRGEAAVDGEALGAGDAIGLSDVATVRVQPGASGADVLVIDLD
ncbi:Quercetin 2,3-dioxygenase [Planctomycetes bacterium Poly30]|uniref:Quercetin 2,3-dioxygenase n=1 Tax=Saltatorellus ferox TaxID=2528018 RepID=A0A518EPF9_9BACT|nr:Quercetin 2,3-dioxygenase [Planctomycetes bacterium Poly30]